MKEQLYYERHYKIPIEDIKSKFNIIGNVGDRISLNDGHLWLSTTEKILDTINEDKK